MSNYLIGGGMELYANGTEHLLAELGRLDLILQRHVLWMRAANLITEDDEYRGLYVPDTLVDALLASRSQAGASSDVGEASRHLSNLIDVIRDEISETARASREAGVKLPLWDIAERFGLDEFELDVLLLCAAPELDLGYQSLYAYAQNDGTRKHPSVDLALKLFCPTLEDRAAYQAYFSPEGALLHNRLVHLFDDPQDREPPLPGKLLKADQRLMDELLERDSMDERLAPFTRRVNDQQSFERLPLPAGLIGQLEIAAEHLSRSLVGSSPVFIFHGLYGAGKQAAAEAMCAALRIPLLVADLRQTQASETPLPTLLDLLGREAALTGAGLYLAGVEVLLPAEGAPQSQAPAVLDSLFTLGEKSRGPVFLGSDSPWRGPFRPAKTQVYAFEFPLADYPIRLDAWQRAAGMIGLAGRLNGDLVGLASKFRLSPGQIRDAARQAAGWASLRPEGQRWVTVDDLHDAARAQSSHGLHRMAQKIEPLYRWGDIKLPPRPMQQLQEVYASVKFRHIVYSEWGFENKLALGKGLNVLFSGPSGTGKTMAAGILAGELKLDLYKIDLASVVSKYIGETEKNLDRVFKEAKTSNAMLFFDEADAVFGRRSEVKDAHDRYANIEVAYLLQKMEEYDGIVILATNLRKNIDEAFARRMHHTIEFPFPDAAYRGKIWQGIFPSGDLLARDVDLRFLAQQFELAGGSIRNIALAAAFLAAEAGSQITMEHLIIGTAREIYKMGKLPSKASFRQYYDLIREVPEGRGGEMES